MSPGKLVDEKDVGCQDKSGPGKIHEVILVNNENENASIEAKAWKDIKSKFLYS